ncbi:MAG: hypothetical protein AB1352_05410 [Patescibacteria group bacterium]
MKFILLLIILFMVQWVLSATTHAVGISVSPPALELNGDAHKKITGTFTVMNPSREMVIYEVSNDGLLPLTITPTTFLLEPNETAQVAVEYIPSISPINHATIQQSTTNLSVLGRPLTVQPTQAATGIKLPVTITTGQIASAATTRNDPSVIGVAIMSILLILLATIIVTPHVPSSAGQPPR